MWEPHIIDRKLSGRHQAVCGYNVLTHFKLFMCLQNLNLSELSKSITTKEHGHGSTTDILTNSTVNIWKCSSKCITTADQPGLALSF